MCYKIDGRSLLVASARVYQWHYAEKCGASSLVPSPELRTKSVVMCIWRYCTWNPILFLGRKL